MTFISFAFMVFLPCAVLINFIVPIKYRYIWLLIASMVFYSTAGIGAMIVLVLSMLSVYATGIYLGKKKKAKLVFLLCLLFNLGILFVFKYFNFFMQILGIATDGAYGNIQLTNMIIPLGLSFYILKSVGYLIDVYRGDIAPEKNYLKFALFVSFFPQIVAGPIERGGNLLKQFDNPKPIDFDRFRNGFLQVLWGYFLKLVVADRLAIFVKAVFDAEDGIRGTVSFVAILFYTFEIYADFAGYSHISIGIARILGIDVMNKAIYDPVSVGKHQNKRNNCGSEYPGLTVLLFIGVLKYE